MCDFDLNLATADPDLDPPPAIELKTRDGENLCCGIMVFWV